MSIRIGAGVFAALLLTLLAGAWAQSNPPTKPAETPPPSAAVQPPVAPTDTTHVDGFRSAKWGMTEAQVKAAIHTEFNIPEDKLKSTVNLSEKTQVMTISVPNLLEGAGTAQVSYIFGFTGKKLIQVNVLWSTLADQQTTPQQLLAAADQLRLLFMRSGYDPKTIASNVKMPDGSTLVFQGEDADKHSTILRLASGTTTPPERDGKPGKPVEVAVLSLSYILDAQNPDIYRLKKGEF
jgi:hypothetical protein